MPSTHLPRSIAAVAALVALPLVVRAGTPGGEGRLGTPVRATREGVEPKERTPAAKPSDNLYDSSFAMHGDPTAEEQLVLELINRARQDPVAEGVRLNILPDIYEGMTPADIANTIPRAPLAFNGRLIEAARLHSLDMQARAFFDHTNPSGDGPGDRITAQGYPWNSYGENITVGFGAAENHHNALVIDTGIVDRGHRVNILAHPSFREIGIGHNPASGGWVTEDFGSRFDLNAFIVGVVYDDADGDGFYDPGEGIGGVTVMPDEGDWHAITSSSGGYAIPMAGAIADTVGVTFTFPAAYGGVGALKSVNVDNPLERKLDCTLQETGAFGSVSFGSATYTVLESGVSVDVTVARTGGSVGAVSVDYATSDGTATAPGDYTSASDTLSWGHLDAADKTFTVFIIDDGIDQGDKTVVLTLSNPQGGVALAPPSTATVTIIDDDQPGEVAFVSAAVSTTEPDAVPTQVTLQVERTGGNNGAATVQFSTAEVSASAGADYTAVASGTVSWADDEDGPKDALIDILGDLDLEFDETFTVTLSSPTTVTLASPAVATVTILDNEVDSSAPTLAVGAPLDGETVQGTVAVSGTAGDNLAVSAVELSVDGGPFVPAAGVTLSTSVNWSFEWRSWEVPNGVHTLTVRVTDYRGTTTAQAVTVTVDNELGVSGGRGCSSPLASPPATNALPAALAALLAVAVLHARRHRAERRE